MSSEAAGALVICEHINSQNSGPWYLKYTNWIKKIGNFTINANIIQMKKIES